jgi:L-ascorbate metabolism protein UlaG (beta-lactamase superfamily)
LPEASPAGPGAGTVTWMGHSTVLIELDGVRLLTDPVLRARVAHLRRVPALGALPADIDAVLVSHAHHDHLDPASLARLGRDRRIIVPRGAGLPLRLRGFRRIEQVGVGEEIRMGAVTIRATHADHRGRRFGAPGPPWGGAAGRRALGYVVAGRRLVYFAGDTDVFEGMSDLAPGLDLALLPIWGWGRRVGPGHMDPLRAARALRLLRPRVAIPIHWGTLVSLWRPGAAAGAPAEPALAFQRHARQMAPSVEVQVLPPGGSTRV